MNLSPQVTAQDALQDSTITFVIGLFSLKKDVRINHAFDLSGPGTVRGKG